VLKVAKVIVLDDDRVQAWCLQLALEGEGHDVQMCLTAEQTFSTCETFRPDVLVTDHNLRQGLSGVEVALLLERKFPDLRCVVVSGRPLSEIAPLSQSLSNVQIFEKPVDLCILIDSVSLSLNEQQAVVGVEQH
jgi:DNA-binding NtrC family response regulator